MTFRSRGEAGPIIHGACAGNVLSANRGRRPSIVLAGIHQPLQAEGITTGFGSEGVIKRAEIEIVLLEEPPNFKPEQFIDDDFYQAALKALAGEPGAKK